MFRLYLVNDTSIGVAEKLNYIRKHTNGCLVLCDVQEAQGVAFNGEVYSIGGPNGFTDKPVIFIEETDTAVELEKNSTTTSITFVTMAESGAIDDVTASEHSELFSPWAYPIAYEAGQIRSYTDGKLYRCISAHTSQEDWAPDVAVSLWTPISDPAIEFPEWSQPVGAHDAYALGDKVTHNEKKWVSDVNNNVWEPGVYGWTEYVEG